MELWESVDGAQHIEVAPESEIPCAGCVAPCCWAMKITQIEVENAHDLEYLHFLSGFPQIELAYDGAGRFRVFYRAPCDALDRTSGRFDCRLHGTDDKPKTCVSYDEHDCYYRKGLLGTPEQGLPVVRLDRARWLALAPAFSIDGRGRITARPEPLEAWARVRDVATPPVPRRTSELSAEPLGARDFDPTSSPCDGCSAVCCKALLFDRRPPSTRDSLELRRYQVGFPGVEIAVSATGWRTLIRVTCQFLDADRCSLFGAPERPALCSGYNPIACDYRRFFSAGAAHVVRLGRAEVARLIDVAPVNRASELPNPFGLQEVRSLL